MVENINEMIEDFLDTMTGQYLFFLSRESGEWAASIDLIDGTYRASGMTPEMALTNLRSVIISK